jgi:hypothetical protein
LNPGTRRFLDQDKSTNDIGFRCVMSYLGRGKSSNDGEFNAPMDME